MKKSVKAKQKLVLEPKTGSIFLLTKKVFF